MSVSVVPFTTIRAPGSPAITTFSDTFNRASARAANKNWQEVVWFYGGLGTNRRTEMIIGATGGVQGLVSNSQSQNNPTVGSQTFLLNIPLIPAVWGQSQAIKARYVEETAQPFGSGGLGSMFDLNAYAPSFYQLSLANGNYNLYRTNAGVATELKANAARPAAIPFDVELKTTVNVGNVTLEVLFNDVLEATVVDSAAGRLTSGIVGFFGDETQSGGIATRRGFINFVGRRL